MATTPFSSQKSVSPRLAWRTLRDAHTKHLRTQIFVLLAFAKHASPKFSSRKIKKFAGGRRLAIPKRADELVEVAASSSAVARATHEREVHQLVRTRSRRSARQSPKHSPGAGPRTTSRHTPTRDLSTLFRALFFLQLSARKLFALDVERAQSFEHCSPRHWRAALAGGQRLGKPGARSASRFGTPEATVLMLRSEAGWCCWRARGRATSR